MRQITIGDAKPGMVLARPIVNGRGRTIVKAGVALSSLYISRLDRWGVSQLFIAEEGEAGRTGDGSGELAAAVTGGAGGAKKAGPGGNVPPGVYTGDDLESRIDQTFAQVIDQPLMAALHEVVKRNLLDAGGGSGGNGG
jgi:hypothetical protein